MAARPYVSARQSHSYRQPAAPRPGHYADPGREVRATAGLAVEHVTVPPKPLSTNSNRYINGRSAYSAGTDGQHLSP